MCASCSFSLSFFLFFDCLSIYSLIFFLHCRDLCSDPYIPCKFCRFCADHKLLSDFVCAADRECWNVELNANVRFGKNVIYSLSLLTRRWKSVRVWVSVQIEICSEYHSLQQALPFVSPDINTFRHLKLGSSSTDKKSHSRVGVLLVRKMWQEPHLKMVVGWHSEKSNNSRFIPRLLCIRSLAKWRRSTEDAEM